MRGHYPFVQRRRLSVRLRRLREQAGETQQEVADALEWSLSKVIRIETATVTISIADLRILLSHFQIEDAEVIEDLLAASRASRGKPWWDDHKDILTAEFRKLLSFESSSSVIREYCPQIVSGLFQERPYALALAEAAASELLGFDHSTLERWVDARMKRQELLDEPDAPSVHLILGETVLRQVVASPETTASQLRHLGDLAARPGFTVQVLPFDAGPHNGVWGPFTLHELVDGDKRENILFLESAGTDLLIRDNPELSARFVRRFERLAEVADRPDKTTAILEEAIRQLR